MKIDREDFKRLLKEKGLKMTRQRLVVLEVLAESSGQHLTAEEIYERIKAANPDIGLATVYRTVQLLLELGLIDRINLDDGCVRYEIGHLLTDETKHNHHHLICRKCGRVIPFDADLLDELEEHIEEAAGFHVQDHEVKFYGLCSDCMKSEKSGC